jgi:hypothetical protein
MPLNGNVEANMPTTIENIRLMRDGFATPVRWDDIIGMVFGPTTTAQGVNIQIEVSGDPMPSEIEVQIESRVPNGDTSGTTTIRTPLTWRVPRYQSSNLYRLAKSIPETGQFILSGGAREVATVSRVGGTSDAAFRTALGSSYTSRGRATQTVAGTEATDQPDAIRLLQAGGVEVLTVRVVPKEGLIVRNGSVHRLIRSPADIFYYTGHGLLNQNCLAVESSAQNYTCWASASDLIPHWRGRMDLGLLIIAGCSVLHIDTTTLRGPGLAWSRLLTSKGGPLYALLGYQGSSPSDSGGGNSIATAMGHRIASGDRRFVQSWLEINKQQRAWNAVAINTSGYWWLESGLFGGSIEGPKPIP